MAGKCYFLIIFLGCYVKSQEIDSNGVNKNFTACLEESNLSTNDIIDHFYEDRQISEQDLIMSKYLKCISKKVGTFNQNEELDLEKFKKLILNIMKVMKMI